MIYVPKESSKVNELQRQGAVIKVFQYIFKALYKQMKEKERLPWKRGD